MFDKKRLARITRFIPLLKCKWRIKYYTEQYAHVRRVFDDAKKKICYLNNDVLARNETPGILCKEEWSSCSKNAVKIQNKRVQGTEAILWKKGGRRNSHAVRHKRKAPLPKSVPVDPRDIWQTEAIIQLLGHARKWGCSRRPSGEPCVAREGRGSSHTREVNR